MRGKKAKELKSIVMEMCPNLIGNPEMFAREFKRIKKLYKKAVRQGKLNYKQRKG